MTSETHANAGGTNMRRNSDPNQLPLWEYCDLCNGIHYGLGLDAFGRSREHRACDVAVERWWRTDNHADWADMPSHHYVDPSEMQATR